MLGGLVVLSSVAGWCADVLESDSPDQVRALAMWLLLAALVMTGFAFYWRAERDGARRWLRWYVMLAELRRESDNPDVRTIATEALRGHSVNRPPGPWEEGDPVVKELRETEAGALRDAAELLMAVHDFRAENPPREDA